MRKNSVLTPEQEQFCLAYRQVLLSGVVGPFGVACEVVGRDVEEVTGWMFDDEDAVTEFWEIATDLYERRGR